MGMFNAMEVSATGMTAQRYRTDIIAQNLANINSTRGEDGEPYRRKTVIMAEQNKTAFGNVMQTVMGSQVNGVKVTAVAKDMSDLRMVYEPSNPDADANGYVSYPNVDTVTEMTDMIDASRSYEANVTAFNASKSMALKGLEVGKN